MNFISFNENDLEEKLEKINKKETLSFSQSHIRLGIENNHIKYGNGMEWEDNVTISSNEISKISIEISEPHQWLGFGMRDFRLIDNNGDLHKAHSIIENQTNKNGLVDWDIYYNRLDLTMNFKTTAGFLNNDYRLLMVGLNENEIGWVSIERILQNNQTASIELNFNTITPKLKGISFINQVDYPQGASAKYYKTTLYNLNDEVIGRNHSFIPRDTLFQTKIGDDLELTEEDFNTESEED